MEIVCAGYPKTGSKSCSEALRILGYKVADYAETGEFLTEDWLSFINGTGSIEQVVGMNLSINIYVMITVNN